MENQDKKSSMVLTAAILLGGFLFLYLNLFYLPGTPIHLHFDESASLFNAKRMVDGQSIYRDFFQFTLPATEVVYFLLFKIFGVHAWIPNATLIVLGLCLAYLMIVISRKVIPGKAAYLPAVLFLVVPFRSHLMATHQWYSTLAVMAAIALLIEKITALRLVGAGALCGVATCFTQSRGVPAAIALALFLLWVTARKTLTWADFRRAEIYLWGSFLTIVVLFNAYFALRSGLGKFLSDTVVFGFRYWPAEAWNSFKVYMIDAPQFHAWYRLLALAIWFSIYLLVPLIYILFFVRYWEEEEERSGEPWDRLVLISLTGLAIFLGVAGAPSWLRLCAVAPPGVILFVWFLNSPGRFSPAGKFRDIRVMAVWALALLIAVGECAQRRTGWRGYVTLPIGRVAVLDRVQYNEIKYLLDRTKPGEYLFGNHELNYLLGLRDPAPVPYVTPSEYTRPKQVQEVVAALQSHPVKFVFWSVNLNMPSDDPHNRNNLAPLLEYLQAHYQVAETFPNDDTFWEKRNPLAQEPTLPAVQTLPSSQPPETPEIYPVP